MNALANKIKIHLDLTKQYDAVAAINRMAGNYIVPTTETALHQLNKIILPEVRETLDGLIAEDEHEIRDGVGDILFTVAGLYARLGYAFPESIIVPTHLKYTREEAALSTLTLMGVCEEAATLVAIHGLEAYGEKLNAHMETMLRIACRIGHMHGYPVEQDLQAVVDSNFTKFDKTEDDAWQTKAKYSQLGVDTEYHQASYEGTKLYVTKVATAGKGSDGKNYPAGKWVKSVNFKEPVYSSLVEVASA